MHNIKKLKQFVSLSWKISPSYIILLILSSVISSGQIMINVILPKFLIDELIGNKDTRALIILGSLIVLSNVLFSFLANTLKRLMEIKNIEVSEKMSQVMAEKIMNVEFAHLENPYYLDLKERAVFAVNNQGALVNLINNMAIMLKNLVTIIGLLAIMFLLSWVLVSLLIVTIILSFLVYRLFMNYQLNFFKEIIPVNRKYGYYVGLCFNDKIQKDIRLFSMSDMLTDRVTKYNKEINSWFSSYYTKQGFYMGLYGIINNLQAVLAYGYVGLRVITTKFGPRIGIGSFTMYVSSAIGFTTASVALGNSFMSIMQMLGYLDPYMEFMNLKDEANQVGTIPFEGDIETISFQNISFQYPGSDQIVLDDISFDINKGEKISIVGLNGAGKTTLIKLLCRLYHPTKGKIIINGHDILDYEYESYIKKITAVFQDYKLFAFSIEENITGNQMIHDQQVTKIIEQVGLKDKISRLPNGLSSMVGKAYEESGVELSGGESQKIAIARALYKDASLIILDEPTSALDPHAEAEIYSHFNDLIVNKTAIYISHRMSSSVFCDKVLIIDQGKVTDYNSHKNLMLKKDGLYYKLFQAQAVNYQS